MQELRLSEVPEYLRDGELYTLLVGNSEDPNEVLTFETSVLKENTRVGSAHDFNQLMSTLRFWGVNMFFEEIAAFVLNNPLEKTDKVLATYEEQFLYARALRRIKKGRRDDWEGQLSDAIEAGCVEVVRYMTKGKSLVLFQSWMLVCWPLVVVTQICWHLCIRLDMHCIRLQRARLQCTDTSTA